MIKKSAPPPRIEPPASDTLPRHVAARVFGGASLVCLIAALAYQLLPLALPPARQHALVALCLAAAVLIGVCTRTMRRTSLRVASLISCWTGVILVGGISIALGEGINALALGFLGLIVCAASLGVGLRAGAWLAGACAAIVGALAWAEAAGWLHGTRATAQEPLLLRVATQWLMLGFSLSIGAMMSRISASHLGDANERERRLQSVLHLAAEWYWEMDAALRYTHVTEGSTAGSGVPARTRIGYAPWDIEGYGLDGAGMLQHRADLEARRPFNGLLLKQHDERGRRRFARISGEPRFDQRGQFIGYVGVGRDATREVTARRAVVASETRYRELFERTPSPLILHQGSQVLDANAAALALLGYNSGAAFIGSDMLRHYHGGDSIRRARQRIDKLDASPVGASQPEAEYEMQTLDGRRCTVRASSVRVQTADGPATLSIFFDDTERLVASAALRRSEALLSHVVATSPDAVVLTETETGRLARVNGAFTRLSGYSAEEALGRTADELKLWHRQADRTAVRDRLARAERGDAMPVTFVGKHGQLIDTLLSTARFDLDGQSYSVGTARDVTQLERLRQEYEAMLKYAAIGIAFTRDRCYLQTNLAWERMFRWPAGGLIGQSDAVSWPDVEAYAQVLVESSALLQQGQPYETEQLMRRSDDTSFLCHLRAQVINPDDPAESGTIWIAEDVTERRRVETALAAARDSAELANRAKSAFLANTSHEIRTPLNGLLGLTRLALRPDLDAARRLQYLGQILDSANNLSGIISDILDLSKIEAGKLTFESVPFDLRGLLDAVQRNYHELAVAHGLRLTMTIEHDVPRHVHGDALRVRQILSNYINNALKFTSTGEIRLDVRCGDALTMVRFAVTDTGCGMDPPTLARMFKPFTQADESTTRRFGGTGLGLSICQELAQLMGGRIGATSRVDVGSTFWAELPLPVASGSPLPNDVAPNSEQLAGARVLMVEDNVVNMMIAVATLEQWGVQVTQASDGQAAIDALAQASALGQPFHAVLMDVQMPVMGGHEAARLMRRTHDKRSLPIIALTAAALVSERDEAMAAGMNEFLTKPIDPDKLRRVLGTVIAESTTAP